MQKDIADLNTIASMLIEPEEIPYTPEPQQTPERVFVARMDAIPGVAPPAQQQNLFSAGLQTISSYASMAMTGMDLYNSIGNLSSMGMQSSSSGSTLMSGNVVSNKNIG